MPENNLRSLLETAKNIGKIISINVEIGKYEIGDDLIATSRRLQAKQANEPIWAGRISFNTVDIINLLLTHRLLCFTMQSFSNPK
jgi:hypothetical protein